MLGKNFQSGGVAKWAKPDGTLGISKRILGSKMGTGDWANVVCLAESFRPTPFKSVSIVADGNKSS